MTGLEALVRWRHRDRGLLDPVDFVSIAEDSGLIEPIGRWVQERAARQVLEWHELRPDARPLDVAVNLSARQVAHRDLAADVAEVIARTGLDPVHLRLEITETVLVEESAAAIASLEALNELGVRLVLDDFGTGYSSLAYLNRFPFHALKIDRSFVDTLGVEQEGTAIVEAVIGMARALSLDVIAEGVEKRGPARRAAPARLRLRPGPPLPRGAAAGGDQPADRGRRARLFRDFVDQVGVGEQFGRLRQVRDQFFVAHPGGERFPLFRVHVAVRLAGRRCRRAAAASPRSAASVSFGSRLVLAARIASLAAFGFATAASVPRFRALMKRRIFCPLLPRVERRATKTSSS